MSSFINNTSENGVNQFAPFSIIAKPVGSTCNLRCKYCYYIDKASELGYYGKTIMTLETLENYIKKYILSHPEGHRVDFIWHGGEATILPLGFYKKAVELQIKYSSNRIISNSLQTNGTLLNDEWCRFLKKNNWLVGISIDGDMDVHDEYRKTETGKGSFLRVMRGIRLLNRYGIEWNAMAVVNDYNSEYPLDFYHFFKGIGCKYLQFTPIVERFEQNSTYSDANSDIMPFSVKPEKWGHFLCTIFDEWVKSDVGDVFVQIFDATLANWVKVVPGLCSLGDNCGASLVMEHNGDIFSCDHFVSHQYRIGNINTDSIREIINNNCHQIFAKNKTDNLPEECNSCQWKTLCNGGCQKDRFVPSVSGKKSINYLCKGYKHFFEHTASAMQFMKNEILNRRPPSNIMRSGILNNQESTI